MDPNINNNPNINTNPVASANGNKKPLIVVFIIAFLILIVGVMTLLSRRSQVDKQSAASVSQAPEKQESTPTVDLNNSYFKLSTQDGLVNYAKGQNVVLNIRANSDNKDIVGFDILLSYDKEAFDLVKVASLIPDFKVYNYQKDNYLSMTALKSITSNSAFIFTDTPVVEVIFAPKNAGNYSFLIKQTEGKEKTKLVDVKTQILYPRVDSIALEIN